MDINAPQELPVQLAPVYFQYAVDKIICSRGPQDTQSKAIKCIGLYGVIVRMSAELPDITHAALAERIGTTYQGILNPLEYLKRLKLVSTNPYRAPGSSINVRHLQVSQPLVESAKRELKRISKLQPGADLTDNGLSVPVQWHDAFSLLLDSRRENDTPAKALKAIGLIPIMARLAAIGLPVTRPVLANRLSIAENTLSPLVSFLQERDLITVKERRIKGHIGSEFAIYLPPAIVERVRRALRRLEKEGESRGWPYSQHYRRIVCEAYRKLTEQYGNRIETE